MSYRFWRRKHSLENAPYVAPFQYFFVNSQLYFHFTRYGKKMGLLEEGKSVCIEIEKCTQDLSEYRFVVLTGSLRMVAEPQERALAIEKMVDAAKTKGLSKNFLVAHGFPKEMGWDFLTPDKPMIIVKLENITERMGLR